MTDTPLVAATLWRPILDGKLAHDARQAVKDVAREIVNGFAEQARPTDLILFWAYAAVVLKEDWVAEQRDKACAALCGQALRNRSLHDGAAGVGFVLSHVGESTDVNEALEIIDGLLLRFLEVELWTRPYDLIRGLVGIGVYLLERVSASDTPIARKALDRVIDHLIATRETTSDGATWHTAPEWLLLAKERVRWPAGYFDCGLAHGVSGIVAFLGRAAELPNPPARARPLADETLRWLWAQQLPTGRFPCVFGRDTTERLPARMAWCNGDPGIAISIWSTTLRLGMPTPRVVEFARETARRPFESSGVRDAAMCHGAAGLAHIFNRFFQVSGDPVFCDAARAWFQRTLDLRQTHGLGGFAVWAQYAPGERFGWVSATGLVEGAIGVALALIAALEPIEPRWDRLLQCDMPERR